MKNSSLNNLMSRTKENMADAIKIQLINNALKEDITQLDLWLALAKEYEKAKEYENAEYAYKQLLEKKDDFDSNLYFSLAHILILQEKYEEASKVFAASRKLQEAHGVNEEPYNKDKKLQDIIDYTNIYEKNNIKGDKDNIVLLESFSGEAFSDNPYALFKEMYKNSFFKEWKFVWVLNNSDVLPDKYKEDTNIIVVKRNTYKYFKYLVISRVLITNAVFPIYFIKQENQIYINTWHGTPWKTLGNDNPMQNGNTARNFIQADYLVSPNQHTSNVYLNSYGIKGFFKGKLLESGYPRIDSMLNSTIETKNNIKNILNIKNDKPIILYAPTYKGLWSTPDMEAEEVMKYINAIKSEDYNVIFRGHYFVEAAIELHHLDVTIAPHSIDTCELLSIVDMLITDYSSIFFDFLPLSKPIFLFVYDYEEYKKDRGLYFELDEVPGFVTKDIKTLKENIQKAIASPNIYSEKNSKYIDKFAPYEDGNSSKRVVEELKIALLGNIEYTDNNEKESIIIYPGSVKELSDLVQLEEFISNLDHNKLDIFVLFNRTELVSNKDIKHKIDDIPGIVSCLEYSGEPDKILEERWIFSKIKNKTIKLTKEQKDIIKVFYEREFKRLFSNKTFTYSVILKQFDQRIDLVFSSDNIEKSYILDSEDNAIIEVEGSTAKVVNEQKLRNTLGVK